LARLGKDAIGYEPLGGYELLTEAQMPALAHTEAINNLLAPLLGQRVFQQQDAKLKHFGFSEQVKALLFNPLEGQIHTGKMMQRLQHYVQQKGAQILSGAEVAHIQSSTQGVEASVNIPFEKQKTLDFKAKKIFVCTNAFSKQLFPHLDLQPGRGQVLMTGPVADLPFRGAFHFEEGYYYFRNVGQAVLFGGGRHRAMEAESTTEIAVSDFIMDDLEEKLRTFILPHRSFEIQERWAGVMAFNTARKPILEEVDKGILLGLCLNGMGVAIGTEVGARLAERW
jgi:glycine/D-amino acid oxidase-like deaminating enzyme